MHSRIVVVAVTVLFLFTGIVSSTTCEMMCIPANQAVVCCAHQMKHCTDAASVTSARECSHPQEETTPAAAVAQLLQPHSATIINRVLTAPPVTIIAAHDESLQGSSIRPSFIPPLRI